MIFQERSPPKTRKKTDSMNSLQTSVFVKDRSIFDMLLAYLKSVMMQWLNPKEYQVLRLSYGLDCNKHSAKEIAEVLGIKGSSSYVRVSQLKKHAIQKLTESVPHSQVVDYL